MRALAMQGATVEPWVGSLASFTGGFHPVVVHLPIGIFALAVGLELLATRRRFAPAVDAAQSLVLAAACASAVLAFVLGVALGSGGGYPTPLLDRHRAFASATIDGIAACGIAWWAHRQGEDPDREVDDDGVEATDERRERTHPRLDGRALHRQRAHLGPPLVGGAAPLVVTGKW